MTQAVPLEQPRKLRRVHRFTVADALIYFFITLVSLTCILPFWQVFAISISSNSAVISNQVFLIPRGFQLVAYASILQDASMIRSLVFTVWLTATFTILGMALIICAAYPLSRNRLVGHNAISTFFLITLYFGAGIIPNYLLINSLHMINTFWSLLLPLAFSPFNMIIMKSYIENNIPISLEEAAKLDGCSDIGILLRVILPLSKPVIATLCLFFAVGRWNSFQDALFYISSQNLFPLQLKLNNLISASQDTSSISNEAGGGLAMQSSQIVQAACTMFATIPIIIVYPFVQKYFVKGVMIGAVKG